MDKFKKQFLIFCTECIEKRTFIPLLNALHYPHSQAIQSDKDTVLMDYVLGRTQVDRHALLRESVPLLKTIFLDDDGEKLRLVAQELEERAATTLPGVAFYITLAVLLSQNEYKGGKEADSLRLILQKGILDAIQNPLYDINDEIYFVYIGELFSKNTPEYRKALNAKGLAFLDKVIGNLNSASLDELRDALFILIDTQNFKLQSSSNWLDTSAITDYLNNHPYTLNRLVIEGFSKHFKIAEEFKAIPLLWHVAFLDQWMHENHSVPEELPRTIAWLHRQNNLKFIRACMTSAQGQAYLDLLSQKALPTFVHIFLSNYYELKSNERSEAFYEAFLEQIPVLKILSYKTDPDTTRILQLLEAIDHASHPLSMQLLPLPLALRIADVLLDLYPLQGVFKRNFLETSQELGKYIKTQSAQRVAYLALLDRKLSELINPELTTDNLILLAQLLKRGFDLEKYSVPGKEIAQIMYLMMVEKALPFYLNASELKNEKHKEAIRDFLNAYVDLFIKVLPDMESMMKVEFASLFNFLLKSQEHLMDKESVDGIRSKLKDAGIAFDSEYSSVFVLFNVTNSMEEDNMYNSVVEGLINRSDMAHALKFMSYIREYQKEVARVPMVYLPPFGYGFIYKEDEFISYDNTEKLHVIAFYGQTLPDTIPVKIEINRQKQFWIDSVEAISEHSEGVKYLHLYLKYIQHYESLLREIFSEKVKVSLAPATAWVNPSLVPVGGLSIKDLKSYHKFGGESKLSM